MDLDIRYVAGLFDGEGWVTIGKQNLGGYRQYSDLYVRYQLITGIQMTYRPIIEQLHQQFGGGLSLRKYAKETHRRGYMWKVVSDPAAVFLRQLLPYLVVKKDEAEVGLLHQAHIRKHKADFRYRPEMREGIYAEREEFRRQLFALKKRCFDFPVASDPIPTA